MTAATYPKSTDYRLAVQNPHVAFRDLDLAAARPEKTPLGEPVQRGGAFAVTFHLTRGGQDWAVRCFKQELGDLEQRYTKISDTLRRAALPCFAGFEYQADGILIEGRRLPIVKMAWVPGVTLGTYVERHYRDTTRMRTLADRFREAMQMLAGAGIAHGDLQHANIMASDTGITLIDYDGMYVPGIGLAYSNEIGHVNYQSPLRTGTDYNAAMDRFSAIVIMVTLRALERDPGLWDRHWQYDDKLLFGRPDFLDPDASALMRELRAMPDLKTETEQVQVLCRTPLDQMPTLEAFLAGAKVAPGTSVVLAPASARLRQYDVLRATQQAAILARVGDRIEAVGQVVEVKQGMTRFGKPYAFINFGDWRAGAFQIVLWSDSLERFVGRGLDITSFVGRWLSITGLVEEYRGKRHTPQIIVDDPNNLRVLDGEAEAVRLYADGQGVARSVPTRTPTATNDRNDDIRRNLRSRSNPPGAPSNAHASSASQRPSLSPAIPATPSMGPPQGSPQTSRANADIRRNLAKLAAPPTPSAPKPPATRPTSSALSAQLAPPASSASPAPGPVWPSQTVSPLRPASPPIPPSKNANIRKAALIIGGASLVLAMVLGGMFHSSDASTPRPNVTTSQPAVPFQAPATIGPLATPTLTNLPIPPAISTSLAALPTSSGVLSSPSYTPLDGSWVANAPTISVRFFAMPWWAARLNASDADHFALSLADGNVGFESFDIFRYRNKQGSDQPTAWQSEFQGNVAFSSGNAPVVTRKPQPQLAGLNQGQLGQYYYVERATGRQMDVTLWVGQVGSDRVVMVFRGTPDRDRQIDQAVTQVLATMDFAAKP